MATILPARTETFEHTITGLLKKRADLFSEAQSIRDRLGELSNDIAAVDRALRLVGYTAEVDDVMPMKRHVVVFAHGELTNAVCRVLRDAKRPMRSGEIGAAVIVARGQEAGDKRFRVSVTKSVQKVLRTLRDDGYADCTTDERGNLWWEWQAAGAACHRLT